MLKIKLWQIEDILLIKILEIPKNLIDGVVFRSSDNIDIYVQKYPALGSSTLYIPRTLDNPAFTTVQSNKYNSIDVATRVLNKFINAVKEYNKELMKDE